MALTKGFASDKMSDKAGTSVPDWQSDSEDKEVENLFHQAESYDRYQTEMNMPSTSGMASSSEAGRKRPRQMERGNKIKYYETEKTDIASEKGLKILMPQKVHRELQNKRI